MKGKGLCQLFGLWPHIFHLICVNKEASSAEHKTIIIFYYPIRQTPINKGSSLFIQNKIVALNRIIVRNQTRCPPNLHGDIRACFSLHLPPIAHQ